MLRLFVRFFCISSFERILFIRTTATMLYFCILIAVVPRRFILKRIGKSGVQVPEDLSEKDILPVTQVSMAIRRSVKVIPWKVTCFVKAVAGKYMLKQMGITSTHYIGVGKDEAQKLTAHAWLRCGRFIVTGKEEMNRFTPVAFFS